MMLVLTPSRLHKRPVDAHNSVALEALQRFRERQESRVGFRMKTDFAEVSAALSRPHRHDAIVFQKRLEMPIRFRFQPQGVNLWPVAFLDHDGESCGLDLEKLHE